MDGIAHTFYSLSLSLSHTHCIWILGVPEHLTICSLEYENPLNFGHYLRKKKKLKNLQFHQKSQIFKNFF